MERKNNQYVNLPKLLFMCVLTLLFFSCNSACRNTLFNITNLDQHQTLGLVMLEVNFFWGPFGMIFMSFFIQRFYFKVLFFISSMGTVVFLLGTLILINCPSNADNNEWYCKPANMEVIVSIMTLISAPFESIYYCLLNYYIDRCSPQEVKGIFFGMSYSIFGMGTLLAALYGEFLRALNNSVLFYTIMIAMSLVLTFCYWGIQEPTKITPNQTISQQILKDRAIYETSKRKTSSSLSRENSLNLDFNFIEAFKDMFAVYHLKSMSMLLWNLVLIGAASSFVVVNLSYLITGVTPMQTTSKPLPIINTNQTNIDSIFLNQQMLSLNFSNTSVPLPILNSTTSQNQNNGSIKATQIIGALLIYGSGEFFGGISAGLASDLHSRFYTLLWTQGILILGLLIAVLQNPQFIQITAILLRYLFLLNIFCFMLGFSLSALQATIYAMLGQRYYMQPYLFAFINFIYCMGYGFSVLFYSVFVFTNVPTYTCMVYLILISAINLVFMGIFKHRKLHQKSIDVEEGELSRFLN